MSLFSLYVCSWSETSGHNAKIDTRSSFQFSAYIFVIQGLSVFLSNIYNLEKQQMIIRDENKKKPTKVKLMSWSKGDLE